MANKRHRYLTIGVLVVAALFAGVLGYHATHRASASVLTRKASAEQVTVASVASLSPENAPLSVIGEVTSIDQATILSQSAGEIVSLSKDIGGQVYAGETIATIENSSQQAAVVEAQGAYDAANAALVKTGGGGSAADTQAAQVAALESAYTALDDAVHTKSDMLFNYPRSVNPTLLEYFNAIQFYKANNNELVFTVQNERLTVEETLARDYALASATSSTDLTTNISVMAADAQTVGTFLGNLAEAINQLEIQNEANGNAILPAATLVSYQTTVAAARTEVTTVVTDLTGALNTYDASGAEGNVEEAKGALDAAKASLAKTYITSPVSGTIVDLPITEGDYVASGAEVAEISNPGALKIIAHVSAADARMLAVGNAAAVNGTTAGTISQISPAIDPQTGTIEVDVALAGDQSGLTDGDSVTVDLDRKPSALSVASNASASGTASVIIPIVVLKITPTGPEVFTVDPVKSVLVPHPVEIGSILGQNIIVTEGLTPNLMIVTDARGLVAGENVTAKNPLSPDSPASAKPHANTLVPNP